MMSKKDNYNKIKTFVESKNCELLTTYDEYKNVKTKMKYKCSCGNIFEKSFVDFKRRNGHRCKKCSNTHRPTYDEVKNYIESTGCKLLSKEYKNKRTQLKIQCPCGNIFYKTLNNFKNSKYKHCPECSWDTRRVDEFKIKGMLEEVGCELLSKYVKNNKPLKVKCSCGNIFYRAYVTFMNGSLKCPE